MQTHPKKPIRNISGKPVNFYGFPPALQLSRSIIKQFLLSHDRRIIIVSVFVFIINYVVVFPMFCFTCLPIYPDEMISWSSLKISDGAQKQFQRIKKSLLPKTRKERILHNHTVPYLPRFFYYGTALNYFISSRCLKIHSITLHSKYCFSNMLFC